MFEWQFLFCIWLVSTTTSSLLYRRFAVKSKLHPLVSAVVRSAFVFVPAMVTVALVTGDFKMPSVSILSLAILEALLGLTYGYSSFYAIKESDASTSTTLVKLSLIPLILLSSLLLGEGLTQAQLAGSILLVGSGLILGKVKLNKSSIRWVMISIILIAILNLLGRYLVESVGVVTMLTLSCTFGLLIHLPFTARKLVQERKVIKKELPMILILGVTIFVQVAAFVWATDLAGNLSLLYSLSSSKIVIVTIAAAIFLGERDNLKVKIPAAALATLGVMLV
jgi:uncharacterized membrane protein